MNIKSPLSDARVLKSSQSYPWMFGMLVDRYQKAFLRKAFFVLHSHDAAEDAVQETFLKIYKYGHQFSERKNAAFSSWAYKILINTCYDHASRRATDSSSLKVMDSIDLDAVGSTDTMPGKNAPSFSLTH